MYQLLNRAYFHLSFQNQSIFEFIKMKFTAVVSLLLATSAFAQTTPLGFTPATNKTLDVYYGTQYISPGIIVRKSSMSARCEGRNNYANANQSRKELLSSVSATRHLAGNTYLQ